VAAEGGRCATDNCPVKCKARQVGKYIVLLYTVFACRDRLHSRTTTSRITMGTFLAACITGTRDDITRLLQRKFRTTVVYLRISLAGNNRDKKYIEKLFHRC